MHRENECIRPSHDAADADSASLYMSITVALKFPLSTMTVTAKWKLAQRPYTKQLCNIQWFKNMTYYGRDLQYKMQVDIQV